VKYYIYTIILFANLFSFNKVNGQTTICPKLINQNDTLICSGVSVVLTHFVTLPTDPTTTPQPQIDYLWSNGENAASIIVSPLQTTKYKITRTSGGYVCTDSVLIMVQDMHTALAQVVNICSATAKTAKIDAGPGFNSYLWNTGESTQSIEVNSGGVYSVALTKGSCSSIDSSNVKFAIPVFDFEVLAKKDSVCEGESDTLRIINPQLGVIYSWYLPNSNTIINSGSEYILSSVINNSSYVINATNDTNICPAKSASVKIILRSKIAKPNLNIDSLGANSLVFSWNAVPNASSYLISLDNGLTFNFPTLGPLALKEIVNGLPVGQPQKLIIKALGIASCETSDTSQIIATTNNPFGDGIYIPNAFTPNSDGVNDIFRIYGTSFSSLHLKIYNQWGELVFISTDLNIGWDGNYKGKKSAASVYTYTLDVKMLDGTEIIKKGSFTLIR
jgi:gliding motility-associated-like protein